MDVRLDRPQSNEAVEFVEQIRERAGPGLVDGRHRRVERRLPADVAEHLLLFPRDESVRSRDQAADLKQEISCLLIVHEFDRRCRIGEDLGIEPEHPASRRACVQRGVLGRAQEFQHLYGDLNLAR